MRLIDAKQLEKQVKEAFETQNPVLIGQLLRWIRKQKTIDAVPAVRCRECIAYTPVDDNTGKCVFLIGEHQYVVPDGYCYLGERKEGADNDT